MYLVRPEKLNLVFIFLTRINLFFLILPDFFSRKALSCLYFTFFYSASSFATAFDPLDVKKIERTTIFCYYKQISLLSKELG